MVGTGWAQRTGWWWGGPSDGEGVDQVEGGRDRVGPEDRVVGVVGTGWAQRGGGGGIRR